jgi:hypothetical protein
LELDARDIALQFGHQDGGELVRKLYGHPDAARARERIRDAFRQAPTAPVPLAPPLGAVVVGPVRARRGHYNCAESLAEPPSDLGEEVVAVRAHDQQHGDGDGG